MNSSPEYSRGWNACAEVWDSNRKEALQRDVTNRSDDYQEGWNESLQRIIQEHRANLERLQQVKEEGYAGVLPGGEVVDRREWPNAIPMQKNSLLNIPEPKPLP